MTDISLPPADLVPPLPTSEEFGGKVALITGGTAGLGLHLTRTLLSFGAEVFFCGHLPEGGLGAVGLDHPQSHHVECDLKDLTACRSLVAQAAEPRRKIDYVVNNAAVDPEGPFEKVSPELLEEVWLTNNRAVFVVTQAALPWLERGEGKAIVNIGTTNWMQGWPGATAYNAAKAGVFGFSRSLARELGPRGIRVNMVSPGWIMTERQLAEKVTPAAAQDLLRSQCVKLLLTEQFVTPATLFLLSKAAAGISGQNLVVDGGFLLQ